MNRDKENNKNKKAVKIVLLSAVLILCFLVACGKKDFPKPSDDVFDKTQENTGADIDLEGDAKGSILKVSYEGNNKIVFTVMDENAASVKETEGTGS